MRRTTLWLLPGAELACWAATAAAAAAWKPLLLLISFAAFLLAQRLDAAFDFLVIEKLLFLLLKGDSPLILRDY